MSDKTKNISIIGAGAWGTALAQVFAAAGNNVILYARDLGLADAINKTRQNGIYLPHIPLNENIRATGSLEEAVVKADIILLATPTQFVRNVLNGLKPYVHPKTLLVNCAKGIEISTGKLLSEVTEEIIPGHPYAVLSGPTFAHEAAKGLPTAVTLATAEREKTAQEWAETLSSKTFRPYLCHDPVGAEIAGALKNVIAIACGIVEGKKLGQNARAAVMTRGMAEIKRLGLARGAAAETFLGLSGIGDLTLTCHSLSSRNYSLGIALGQGQNFEKIMAGRRTVAEGVATAKAVTILATQTKTDIPICTAVNAILHHEAGIDDIIGELLARHLKYEES